MALITGPPPRASPGLLPRPSPGPAAGTGDRGGYGCLPRAVSDRRQDRIRAPIQITNRCCQNRAGYPREMTRKRTARGLCIPRV